MGATLRREALEQVFSIERERIIDGNLNPASRGLPSFLPKQKAQTVDLPLELIIDR